MKNSKTIFVKIINILEKQPMTRKALIDSYIGSLGLTREQLLDKSTSGRANIERSRIGEAISAMLDKGMIARTENGIYVAADQTPVVIRRESCEAEILKMLRTADMTKQQIRRELTRIFGTEKTATEKDDGKLFEYVGDSLRRMVKIGALEMNGSSYSIASKIAARVDDISGMLKLKEAFLTRLHRKGGEFFETYFMTLLGKYYALHGKSVLSNTTTGGSDDGGIDGIMETVDPLGFRETIMVQTKNRNETVNEKAVRGFYGAVCAKLGSRGIFVTVSDFHDAALAFLNSIDNCVGVDGSKLFEMAIETKHGIKNSSAGLTVDDRII